MLCEESAGATLPISGLQLLTAPLTTMTTLDFTSTSAPVVPSASGSSLSPCAPSWCCCLLGLPQPSLCLIGWPAAACRSGTQKSHRKLRTLLFFFSSICNTDVPVHYHSHLVMSLRVCSPSLYLASCYYVLDSLWGAFAQSAVWVLSAVVESCPLWCLGPVHVLPWSEPLCYPVSHLFLAAGRISDVSSF